MKAEKPLFIPLKSEFYEAFERGDKDTEYRAYGPRWNEKTCRVGRAVVLSHGYGKKRRIAGTIAGFRKSSDATPGFKTCYGEKAAMMACIKITIPRCANCKAPIVPNFETSCHKCGANDADET